MILRSERILASIENEVVDAVSDGEWHSCSEICEHIGLSQDLLDCVLFASSYLIGKGNGIKSIVTATCEELQEYIDLLLGRARGLHEKIQTLREEYDLRTEALPWAH